MSNLTHFPLTESTLRKFTTEEKYFMVFNKLQKMHRKHAVHKNAQKNFCFICCYTNSYRFYVFLVILDVLILVLLMCGQKLCLQPFGNRQFVIITAKYWFLSCNLDDFLVVLLTTNLSLLQNNLTQITVWNWRSPVLSMPH